MVRKIVKFNTPESVKDFCNITIHCDFEMDLVKGRYVIDAKSLLGIYSLSLDEPVNLEILVDSEDDCKDFLKKIDNFLCD